MMLKRIIEALVFASQKPLMPREIVQALRSAASEEDPLAQEFAKTKEDEIATLLDELRNEYAAQGRAFQLVEQASGWHVVTTPDYGKWVKQLYPESKPARLSGPALETLAIVAYRQPITKADIEAVRGVAVDGMMQTLLEKGLIRIGGRADVPGRPLLYETTEHFLEHFGLKQVDELPNSAELRRVNLPTAPIEATEEAKPRKKSKEGAAKEEQQPAPEQPGSEARGPAAETPSEEKPAEQPDEQPGDTGEPGHEADPGEVEAPAETPVGEEVSESEPEIEIESEIEPEPEENNPEEEPQESPAQEEPEPPAEEPPAHES